jgi:DNA polymerase-3 subunit gamma/tau
VFENIIQQSAAGILAADIQNGVFPPSALFCGPPASGKATAAIETARVISCAKTAAWTCTCPSCAAHKELCSRDVLIIGPRPFSAEILACAEAFLRDYKTPSAKTLFLRSIRKLLLRFSPIVREGDNDASKYNTVLESLTDILDQFNAVYAAIQRDDEEDGGDDDEADEVCAAPPAALKKITDRAVAEALKLEAAGISDVIPAAHIRRLSYWLRLAPEGARKTVIIENADRMKDEARNSLLKTIEEPPPHAQIILCSARPRALLPTILSRLRPYSFTRRTADAEADIIRRVFRDSAAAQAATAAQNSCRISAYLDSFLPVPKEKLRPLAAWFLTALAFQAARAHQRAGIDGEGGGGIPAELRAIGTACAACAAEFDGGGESREWAFVCTEIARAAGGFKTRSLFSDFVEALTTLVSAALKTSPVRPRYARAIYEAMRRRCAYAVTAVTVFNQSAPLVLEKLFLDMQSDMEAL